MKYLLLLPRLSLSHILPLYFLTSLWGCASCTHIQY
jgi:hypothetical protein